MLGGVCGGGQAARRRTDCWVGEGAKAEQLLAQLSVALVQVVRLQKKEQWDPKGRWEVVAGAAINTGISWARMQKGLEARRACGYC
jgi:hypothetical protein